MATAGGHDRSRYEDRMDPAMIPILRAKSPLERMKMADDLWRSARDMLTNIIRDDHPDWSDERVAREVASRLSHGAV